ncbi:MAG: hypothetical protein ACTIJ9_01390 [Aequorivita sp.]
MSQLLKLTSIGLIAGIVLILVLKLVLITTGNTAYILLFNFDYIPVIKKLEPVWLFGYVFHFVTCILSVMALFYIANGFQTRILLYVFVYTIGGGVLFFLTALSEQPPEADDRLAWVFWTSSHAIFGYVVGILIKKWL